jgi:hypothetical protein
VPGRDGGRCAAIDEDLLLELYDSSKPMLSAEQNNRFIWQNLLKVLYKRCGQHMANGRVFTVTLDADMKPQFIHSATYEEMVDVFELSGPKLARRLQHLMEEGDERADDSRGRGGRTESAAPSFAVDRVARKVCRRIIVLRA